VKKALKIIALSVTIAAFASTFRPPSVMQQILDHTNACANPRSSPSGANPPRYLRRRRVALRLSRLLFTRRGMDASLRSVPAAQSPGVSHHDQTSLLFSLFWGLRLGAATLAGSNTISI